MTRQKDGGRESIVTTDPIRRRERKGNTVSRNLIALLIPALCVAAPASSANVDLGESAATGAADLQSIGALAFGPDGVLFAADSLAASIYALDTEDNDEADGGGGLELTDVVGKIAALLGTSPDDIRIGDLAVNPVSKKAYLSVTRGQGDDARPALLRVEADGTIDLVDLGNVHHSRATLANAPDPGAVSRRGQSLRLESITDLAYTDGKLLATGLSNEEFSSKLRTIDFPFSEVGTGTSIDIYHGAHGRWETYAPVRTMALYDIGTSPHVLAAYTCTPLVTFPVANLTDDLSDDDKLRGTTVAELGNRNRPLDMVVYNKDGKDFVLIANSARGVMKVELASISEVPAITERISDTFGLPYETLALEGVEQLDRFGDEHALLLQSESGTLNLRTIPLP